MPRNQWPILRGIRIPVWRIGRAKTCYVREAILEHLDDLEDAYLADVVMERIRRGDEQILAPEEFWRGLEDWKC